MATVSVVKLKVRRGSDEERKRITLDSGELGFVTNPDAYRLFIGDGTTPGGLSTSLKFFQGSISTGPGAAFINAQAGDLIFNTDDTRLYVLTGVNTLTDFSPRYNDPGAYQFIGPRTDERTVQYNAFGQISVKTNGVSAAQISSDVFDFTQGFTRPTDVSKIRIKYDNSTIKINGSNSLYVDTSAINDNISIKVNGSSKLFVDLANVNAATLPTVNPGPGKLWSSGGVVRVGA